MKTKAPWPIDDCIETQKNVHRIECGLVIASYLLGKPKELRKGDQSRIVDGLKTSHSLLGAISSNVPEEMKTAVKKTRTAIARALAVARNTPMPSNVNSRLKLTTAVSKALDAKVAMETIANGLCRKGRE
jgi:hypothetical protein